MIKQKYHLNPVACDAFASCGHSYTEGSNSHATHGVKGQPVGLVSLKQFITYKNIFKKTTYTILQ
jgi:hypothetical protein